MLEVILVGIAATLGTLVIQGLSSAVAIEAVRALPRRFAIGSGVWANSVSTNTLILILLVGHVLQMAAWAVAFIAVHEFTQFDEAFYHSAVNYTTLGYGDIVMTGRWKLLGPLEAISGVLAVGWSTAIVVTIVIRLARVRQRRRPPHDG